MLMVIVGAGASYDSSPYFFPKSTEAVHVERFRPPLAGELFGNRDYFVETMNGFPDCLPIIPSFQRLRPGATVESVMERLQNESENDSVRKCQLAAIRYYLHFV